MPELRTPLARAVVPVLAGIAFLSLLGLILWVVAAWISGSGTEVRLGDTRFEVGRVDRISDLIDESGPLLFPDLKDPSGERSVVVDHTGSTDSRGWSVYRPFPNDREGTSCLATQIPDSRRFTDCDGRTLDVAELQAAPDVQVIVENQELLALQFADALPQ